MHEEEGEERHPRLFFDISIHTIVEAHMGMHAHMHTQTQGIKKTFNNVLSEMVGKFPSSTWYKFG